MQSCSTLLALFVVGVAAYSSLLHRVLAVKSEYRLPMAKLLVRALSNISPQLFKEVLATI